MRACVSQSFCLLRVSIADVVLFLYAFVFRLDDAGRTASDWVPRPDSRSRLKGLMMMLVTNCHQCASATGEVRWGWPTKCLWSVCLCAFDWSLNSFSTAWHVFGFVVSVVLFRSCVAGGNPSVAYRAGRGIGDDLVDESRKRKEHAKLCDWTNFRSVIV